jgi:DNA polymerase alpha subunit B
MATDHSAELAERFQLPSTSNGLAVLAELQSIIRIHGTDPEDLSFKWESYCMKMGAEETKLDLKTAKDFKKDLQEQLEDKMRGKPNGNIPERRAFTGTPRTGMTSSDMFDLSVLFSHLVPTY